MTTMTRISAGHTTLAQSAYYRALRSHKARCDRRGWIFCQPARDACGFEDDDRVFVLRNVNGVIARFGHTPETKRLRYIEATDRD